MRLILFLYGVNEYVRVPPSERPPFSSLERNSKGPSRTVKKNQQSAFKIYKRLLRYVRPYLWRIGVAIFSMFGYAATVSLASAIPYLTISGFADKKEVIFSSQDIGHLPFDFDIRFAVIWLPMLIFGVLLFKNLFDYIVRYQMASVGIRAVKKVREDLYEHLTTLSSDFYAKGRTGDFLSRITNDVSQIQGAVTDVLADIIKQPIVILVMVPALLFWGGSSGLIAIAIFCLVALPITIIGKYLRKATKSMQERTADITSFIGETLSGMHIIKAFNQEHRAVQKFNEINKSVFDFFKRTIKLSIVQRPLIEVMGGFGAALAIWYSLGEFSAGQFTSFVTALFLLYEPVKKLSKVNSTIQQSIAAGSRIFEVLDEVPTVRDKEGATDFNETLKDVVFEDVSFAYNETTEVLHGVSFKINAGEVFALVGPSGAGKTTLVSFLPRLYDPTGGHITLNGKDISDMTLKSLRNQIAIVSQETVLFNGTIAENISYGRPDATAEEIKQAAIAAHANHFIRDFKDAYETEIGERGMNLSGGQRQRLSIARAILANRPILILDEATAHLDTESEREVQAAIENLMQGRTVFVIAHRLSTIKKADHIIVLEDGVMVQQGTSDSLLKDGGTYKRLYDLQFDL